MRGRWEFWQCGVGLLGGSAIWRLAPWELTASASAFGHRALQVLQRAVDLRPASLFGRDLLLDLGLLGLQPLNLLGAPGDSLSRGLEQEAHRMARFGGARRHVAELFLHGAVEHLELLLRGRVLFLSAPDRVA